MKSIDQRHVCLGSAIPNFPITPVKNFPDMKRITSILFLFLLSAAGFSQSQKPQDLAAQEAGAFLAAMASGNIQSTPKAKNSRTSNLTLGLASERSSTKEWTLDLGIKPVGVSWGSIYYEEQSGLMTIITIDKERDSGVRLLVDPVSKEILDQVEFEISRKELNGIGAISPDGRYLVQDRIFTKKMVIFDLETQTELAVIKKDQGAKYTGTAFNGVAFINDTEYLTVEGDASQITTLSKLKVSMEITRRKLPSNEVVDRWTIPGTDIERWKVQGMNSYLSGINQIAYNPISPWGVPVLAIHNVQNILIYDYSSKRLLQKIETSNRNGAFRPLFFSMKDYIVSAGDVYNLKSGELFSSLRGPRRSVGSEGIIVESSLSECQFTVVGLDRERKERTIGIKGYALPRAITEEIAYKNWLKRCAAKKDSLAVIASTIEPLYAMNSPENDWVYIGTEGANGLADGIGSAIRKDGVRFIIDGFFIAGEFVAGKMENVYEVSMEGEFKDMKLNGFGRHITENKAILEGTFVDGKLDGQGETIDPSGMQYVGDFKNGTFEGKGKITRPNGEMYDGEFVAGKPHGFGIYKDGSTIERCEYYEGQRIDQAYQMKLQADRIERERKLAELQAKQRQEYLAQQQKKKSSNGLLGALAMGAGAGLLGSSAGMDAMQAVELGGAMFQDVQSGGTSNLNNYKSNMMADFEAKRAQYETYSNDYAQKFYSPVKSPSQSGTGSQTTQSNQQTDQGFYSKEWQERQQRIAEMKIRTAQKKEAQRQKQIQDCQLKDPECKSCHCQGLLNCNKGASNCSPD